MARSAAKSRTCFVISPIGAPDSEIRKHADTIFKYIIKPATDRCDLVAHRSDHLQKPGRITEEMHSHILNDDICIALLTGRNPNVYYELAVAQSASRPVVLLIQRGEEIPFDIKDFRLVTYDYYPDHPSSAVKKLYANSVANVVQFIRAIKAAGWKAGGEIPGIDKAGKVDEPIEYFAKSSLYGSHQKWMGLLQETKKRFFIMGYALRTWQEGENLARILLAKASSGCDVRVMLLHPNNPAMPQLVNENRPDESIGKVQHDINDMYQYMLALRAKNSRIAVRRIMNGCPRCQITITDSQALFIPYLFSVRPSACPLWAAQQGSTLYGTVEKEFEALWKANAK